MGSSRLGLRSGLSGEDFGRAGLVLRLHDSDNIVERDLGSLDPLGILGQHNGDPDSDDALAHHNVTDGSVGVDLTGMAGLDHITVAELHNLGTLTTELTSDNNLNTLGRCLHDEADDAVARTANGEASEELELEGLGLGLGAEATVLDALGIKLDCSVSEVETLLNDGGELADALALLSEDALGAGGADDDLGPMGCGTDLNPGVAVLGELAGEELVELGVEDTVGNELALGGHFRACGHHDGNAFGIR